MCNVAPCKDWCIWQYSQCPTVLVVKISRDSSATSISHEGLRPSRSEASARTRERRSLSSASAAKSARSCSVRCHSLLRSIKICKCRAACSGCRSVATFSSQRQGIFATGHCDSLGAFCLDCSANKKGQKRGHACIRSTLVRAIGDRRFVLVRVDQETLVGC